RGRQRMQAPWPKQPAQERFDGHPERPSTPAPARNSYLRTRPESNPEQGLLLDQLPQGIQELADGLEVIGSITRIGCVERKQHRNPLLEKRLLPDALCGPPRVT